MKRKFYLKTGFLISILGAFCKIEGFINWNWFLIFSPFIIESFLDLLVNLINKKK